MARQGLRLSAQRRSGRRPRQSRGKRLGDLFSRLRARRRPSIQRLSVEKWAIVIGTEGANDPRPRPTISCAMLSATTSPLFLSATAKLFGQKSTPFSRHFSPRRPHEHGAKGTASPAGRLHTQAQSQDRAAWVASFNPRLFGEGCRRAYQRAQRRAPHPRSILRHCDHGSECCVSWA